jgi:hypothetical protein
LRRPQESRPLLVPGTTDLIDDTTWLDTAPPLSSLDTVQAIAGSDMGALLLTETSGAALNVGPSIGTSSAAGTTQVVVTDTDLDLGWDGGAATPVASGGRSRWGPDPGTYQGSGTPTGGGAGSGGIGGAGFGFRWMGGMRDSGGTRFGSPELVPLPAPVLLGLAGLVAVIVLRRKL